MLKNKIPLEELKVFRATLVHFRCSVSIQFLIPLFFHFILFDVITYSFVSHLPGLPLRVLANFIVSAQLIAQYWFVTLLFSI